MLAGLLGDVPFIEQLFLLVVKYMEKRSQGNSASSGRAWLCPLSITLLKRKEH